MADRRPLALKVIRELRSSLQKDAPNDFASAPLMELISWGVMGHGTRQTAETTQELREAGDLLVRAGLCRFVMREDRGQMVPMIQTTEAASRLADAEIEALIDTSGTASPPSG